MKKLLLIAGTRPGTHLLAPLYDALKKNRAYQPVAILTVPEGIEPISSDLAACFGLGDAAGSIVMSLLPGSPVEQLAEVMTGMEKILVTEKPDLVMVCGSDNVALGAALTAAKLGLPVAAVDAGLRSYERADSEEINRIAIDAMAEYHFVSEHSGEYNLINEGVADEKVFFVGNLAIDSLVKVMEQANQLPVSRAHGFRPKSYALVLLNPEGHFSRKEPLEMMLRLLKEVSSKTAVLIPQFDSIDTLLKQHGLDAAFSEIENVKIISEPLAHAGLLLLLRDSVMLLTDIEELQSEATVMNVPCLTMMESASRPVTIEIGTNVLVGLDEEDIISRVHDILHPGKHKHESNRTKIPEKWDGAAAARIVTVLDRIV
ncbi:MAG: UDP-N-acetyl glucosamine 2-epimerase [Chlorobiaceae bacterium]|nr:UDP-N-acetyl glucosamine 2-epimerase [Chlorobiaceae bacterium]